MQAIFWYNLPLVAYYLYFDLWRVLVSHSRVSGTFACDFVCQSTVRYGDLIPIVSSVRARFAETGSRIDVDLAREILFFNIVIGLCLIPVALLFFILHVRRSGMHRVGTIRETGPIRLTLLVIPIAAIVAIMNVGPLVPQAPVLAHWSGLLVYNGLSLIISLLLMLIVVFVNEWRVIAQEKRDASLFREGMN